ncbi:MAG: hypothetical protein ACLVLH_15495 [Eisenbergiella massiliensis]
MRKWESSLRLWKLWPEEDEDDEEEELSYPGIGQSYQVLEEKLAWLDTLPGRTGSLCKE